PYFDPGPNPYGAPTIILAAVGPKMAEAAGAVADGLAAHVFQTPQYVHDVMMPAVERGLQSSGRSLADFQFKVPVFLVTGRDADEYESAFASIRREIAFYASTPAYRPVLE